VPSTVESIAVLKVRPLPGEIFIVGSISAACVIIDFCSVKSTIMVDQLTDELTERSGYTIGKIAAWLLIIKSRAAILCPMMSKKGKESDESPFDEYRKCLAKSPVFKAFEESSKTTDCDGTVEHFLLESKANALHSVAPFIESSKAFDVSNKIAFETVKLYNVTKTDMFSDVNTIDKKHVTIFNKGTETGIITGLEPTGGLWMVIGMCSAVIRKCKNIPVF
jgi:hypothetical protein